MHRGPNGLQPHCVWERMEEMDGRVKHSHRVERVVASLEFAMRVWWDVATRLSGEKSVPGRSIEFPSKRTDLPRDPARLSAASPVSRLIKCDSSIRFMTERCLPRDIDRDAATIKDI